MRKLGASVPDRAGGLRPKPLSGVLAILALIPCAAACHKQSWPKDDDVYHRQIVMPDPDNGGGVYYTDGKTGKKLPEVCDTYGSGETVCSPASFDKAPPVAQYRAELAAREKEWAVEEKVRAAQKIEVEQMAKLGKQPVYSWKDGHQSVTFLTKSEIDAKFSPKATFRSDSDTRPKDGDKGTLGSTRE